MGSDETTRGQELLEATQSAMKSETSYHQAKQFYIRLFNDVLSKIEQQDGTTVDLSIAGRRVREVFHLDEEALILSAIMSHIIDKEITFKGDHQEGKPPTPQDVGTGVQGGATTLLKILATAMDISQLLASQELSYTMDAPILILTQDEDDVAAQNKMGYVEQEPKGAGKVEEETTASPSS